MTCVAVIPARFGSKRLPGKPLLPLGSKPIIQHVYERVAAVAGVDSVWVATDDVRIAERVQAFGGRAVLTSANHPSGSDRVAEAVSGFDAEWVLNVQGDEPFVDPLLLEALLAAARREPAMPVWTATAPIRSLEEWRNPSIVKVAVTAAGRALYFSRWPIPFTRQVLGGKPWEGAPGAKELLESYPYRRHIGVYLYRKEFLLTFVGWPPCALELAEELEQLRILDHGAVIGVVHAEQAAPGIDTPEDYEWAQRQWEHLQDVAVS